MLLDAKMKGMMRVLLGGRFGVGEPGLLLSSRRLERVLRGFRGWSRRGDLATLATGACRASISESIPERGRGANSGHQQTALRQSSCPPLPDSRPSPRARSKRSNSKLVNFCATANVCEEGTEVVDSRTDNLVSVYLCIPNIVGYLRVLMNCVSFAFCFVNKKLFVILYFLSFNFRCCIGYGSAQLVYCPGLIFLSLLALDIASHWLQMYSSLLSGRASHKDIEDSSHWLLRAYYRHRLLMGFCCVGSEVTYITLFALAGKQPESVVNVIANVVKQRPPFLAPFMLALLGWGTKQAINCLQMKMAADACVSHDMKRGI